MSNNAKVKRLSIASFISQTSISMVNFALVYFLREKGFSSSEIGLSASIYPLMYLIFCIAFPKVIRKHSLKREIALSYVGMLFSVLFVILSPNKALTYFSLCLYGTSMALLWPNMETWITSGTEGNELNKAVSSFNFAWSLGSGVSTLVGGVLSERMASLPLYISIALFIALVITILTTKESRGEKSEEESAVDHSTPLRYFAWVGILLSYAGYSMIITIYPLFALDHLGYSESLTGTLLLFRGITACIAFVVLGKTSRWQFSAPAIVLSQALFIVLVAIMGLIDTPVLYAIFFVALGIDFSLIYILSIFHGAAGAANREVRMMIHEVLLTVGTVAGSLFGGILYENFSFQSILNAILILSIVALAVELPLMKKPGCFNK